MFIGVNTAFVQNRFAVQSIQTSTIIICYIIYRKFAPKPLLKLLTMSSSLVIFASMMVALSRTAAFCHTIIIKGLSFNFDFFQIIARGYNAAIFYQLYHVIDSTDRIYNFAEKPSAALGMFYNKVLQIIGFIDKRFVHLDMNFIGALTRYL